MIFGTATHLLCQESFLTEKMLEDPCMHGLLLLDPDIFQLNSNLIFNAFLLSTFAVFQIELSHAQKPTLSVRLEIEIQSRIRVFS